MSTLPGRLRNVLQPSQENAVPMNNSWKPTSDAMPSTAACTMGPSTSGRSLRSNRNSPAESLSRESADARNTSASSHANGICEHAPAIERTRRQRLRERVLRRRDERHSAFKRVRDDARMIAGAERDLIDETHQRERDEHRGVEAGQKMMRLQTFQQRHIAVARGDAVTAREQQTHRREQQHAHDKAWYGLHRRRCRHIRDVTNRMRAREQAERNPAFCKQTRDTHA